MLAVNLQLLCSAVPAEERVQIVVELGCLPEGTEASGEAACGWTGGAWVLSLSPSPIVSQPPVRLLNACWPCHDHP